MHSTDRVPTEEDLRRYRPNANDRDELPETLQVEYVRRAAVAIGTICLNGGDKRDVQDALVRAYKLPHVQHRTQAHDDAEWFAGLIPGCISADSELIRRVVTDEIAGSRARAAVEALEEEAREILKIEAQRKRGPRYAIKLKSDRPEYCDASSVPPPPKNPTANVSVTANTNIESL